MTENNKKEKMSQDEAFDIIREWGDLMEVRLLDDEFEDLQKELWMAVKNERLVFDEVEEIFTYKLKKPLKTKDGEVKYSMLKIQERPMEKKKGISKYKDDIDSLAAFFGAYCTDMEDSDIAIGFLTRIHDRDQSIISAIILGFFVQMVPGVSPKK